MKAIPFMKWRWVAVALSATALLAAIGSLSIKQLNWGLDFTGGTLVEVAYSNSADLGAIRTELDREGYEGAVVVSFGTDKDVLVRTEIVGKGDPIQLDYRLEKTPGEGAGWKIYNLNVLGVWLVETYRSQFAQEINAKGIDGLIDTLVARNKSNAAKG